MALHTYMNSISGCCDIRKLFYFILSTSVIWTISLIRYPHVGIVAKGVRIIKVALYIAKLPIVLTFQIMVIITIEESNDHNPIFTMQQYTGEVVEYDSIRNINGVAPGTAVGLVSATDQDGISSPAGQIEYQILSGHIVNSVQIFNITNPAVSFAP